MSEEVKEVLDSLGSTFEEFKSENEKRLKEIEKKGHADPLLQEKVDKMSSDVAELCEARQTLELQQKKLRRSNSKNRKIRNSHEQTRSKCI